ncbi:unnamed protein product [Prunus armeniaca]
MLVQPCNLMAQDFLLFLLFSYVISTNIHACKQTERNSLLSFASTLSSPPLNWTSIDCCRWKGITCNQDGWVTHLLLPSKGLKGGIPSSSLGNLTHLTHLNFSYNSLYGSLDTQFFMSLNRLEFLDLSYNFLSGELPLSLPSSNIRTVDLSSNQFHGAIPPSFFQQASSLTSFNVSNNTFTGYLPSSICLKHSSPFLRLLDFSSNLFNGDLAPGLGKCSKLQVFRASHNNIVGLLPEDIYNATKLEEIALPFNSLNGAISDKIVNLTNLASLTSPLIILAASFLSIWGSSPKLRLGNNNLEGDISMLDFSRLSQLTKLDLRINNFTCTVPVSLYSCRSLKAIGLTRNHLEGQIQAEILSLKSLSFLTLGEGMPSDDDMVDFDGFQNLRVLNLADSNLSGQIPVWLSKFKYLEMLNLDGEFPKQLCRLPRLLYEPNIPSQVDQYEFELPIYAFSSITANQSFPTQKLYFYPAMIDLSKNNIVGDIPTEIGQLQLLQELYFDSNNFSGVIPEQVSNLKNLEILNLSMNHLSGRIPLSLASLNFLKEFNVSCNNLEGPIPTSTQLQSFNASAFEGNPKLCGAPLPNKCGPNKDMDVDNKNNKDVENGLHQLPWFYIFATLGFIVGFWGVCGSLVINKTWRYAYFRFIDNLQDRLYMMIS